MKSHRSALVAVTLMAASAWAVEPVTEIIDSFEEPFIQAGNDSPIGPIPGPASAKWQYVGYGPPAWTSCETGLLSHGLQAFAWKLPTMSIPTKCGTGSTCTSGVGVLHKRTSRTIDLYASRPIDWTYPVTFSVDIRGTKLTTGGKWRTGINLPNWPRESSHAAVEWGDTGVPNDQWQTVYSTVTSNPGTAGSKPEMFVDFTVSSTDTPENVAIFDNFRITYVPMASPEVCDNGIDDDLDEKTDCEDIDCLQAASCPCNMEVIWDTDYDSDVDMADFAFLQRCMTGPGSNSSYFDSLSSECKCLDVTGPDGQEDNAINSYDLTEFVYCASGASVA